VIPDLAQWDVVRVRIRSTDKDLHPAVVISRVDMCRDERVPVVNVLYGTSRRPASSPGLTDVVLNGADGLDRPTLVSCDHLHTVTKTSIEIRLGKVTYERRRAFSRTLHRAYALLS
jgi:mRNA-degrading endonuclease toxin of MazEF toxin-antitoxin module